MKNFLYITLLQLMLAAGVYAQGFEIAILEENEIPELEIMETSYFVGKGLYGHINGGSELFHEYGFEALAVQEIKKNGIELVVEIYKMDDPEAAFGIFSVSKRKSAITDTTTAFLCVSPTQNLMCIGNYFISIMNYTQSKEAKIYARKISEVLKNKISTPQFKCPDVFKTEPLKQYRSRVKFLKGPLGVQNNLVSWEQWFTGIEKYKIYYLPADEEGFEFGYIRFKYPADRQQFISNIGSGGNDVQNTESNEADESLVTYKLISDTDIYLLNTDKKTKFGTDILKRL